MYYKEGSHPLFPYNEQEKEEIMKQFGFQDSTLQDEIDAVLEWFEKQPHLMAAGLPRRNLVERLLIWAKGSREKTKHRIDNFYKYRSMAPELVQNRDKHIDSGTMWHFYSMAIIPKLFDHKRVTLLKFTEADPENTIDLKILFKNSVLFGDIRTAYEYALGDIWILDMTKIGIGHLMGFNPVIAQKATQIFQDGCGIRVFAIHILGVPSFAQQLLALFKQFTKPKIMDRLMFHKSLEDLYKYVPKTYLPKDYGGEQPSVEEFKERINIVLKTDETKELLADASKQISDESLRPHDEIDEEYLSGSFKQLDFD